MAPSMRAAPTDQTNRSRLLVADDHPLIIAGVRRTLEGCEDIDLVGEAHTHAELIAMIERRRPNIVMMCLRLPGAEGFEHIEQIRERWPGVKIVVLSACDDRPTIDAALRAGAVAYIVKSASPSDILSALRQTADGTVGDRAPRATGQTVTEPEVSLLSAREVSILSAVATGLTTSAISQDLNVSEHTVKFHLTNIYRKVGVPNRAGAVRYAFEHSLVAA